MRWSTLEARLGLRARVVLQVAWYVGLAGAIWWCWDLAQPRLPYWGL